MAGFDGVDDFLNSQTTLGLGQFRTFNKTLGIAAVANKHYFLFTAGGNPGAATYSGSATTLVQVKGGTTMSHAVLPFVNATNSRKTWGPTGFEASGDSTASTGRLILVDVVAYYQGCVATGNNTMTNTLTIPRYTTGVGLHILADVQTNLGATSRTVTITYVDQDGDTGKTTTVDFLGSELAQTIAHRTAVSPFPAWYIPLASGDYGVRSITSANLTTMGAGTFALVLFKPLYSVAIPSINVVHPQFQVDIPLSRIQELPDDVALSWIYSPGAAAPAAASFSGEVRVTEG